MKETQLEGITQTSNQKKSSKSGKKIFKLLHKVSPKIANSYKKGVTFNQYFPEILALANEKYPEKLQKMIKSRALSLFTCFGAKQLPEYIRGKQYISGRPIERLSSVGMLHGLGGACIAARYVMVAKGIMDPASIDADDLATYISLRVGFGVSYILSIRKELIVDYEIPEREFKKRHFENTLQGKKDPSLKQRAKVALKQIKGSITKNLMRTG